jgi:hypothetical protein
VAEAIRALREAGAGATVPVRADSAFFCAKPVTAIRAAGACHSITVADTKTIRAQVATIPETAWTPIKYRNAVRDADEDRQIPEAEIAEIPYTAFTSKKAEPRTRARLIVRRVRRVRRLNPATAPDGQGELFAAHRHHAFHTTNPPVIDQTEPMHRQHAVIEQVFSDLEDGPLAHLPSGKLHANPARPAPAAPAYNLTRAAGTPASRFHAKATGATIRRTLANIPARTASPARRIRLHPPEHRPREGPSTTLRTRTGHRPAHRATRRNQRGPLQPGPRRTPTRRPPDDHRRPQGPEHPATSPADQQIPTLTPARRIQAEWWGRGCYGRARGPAAESGLRVFSYLLLGIHRIDMRLMSEGSFRIEISRGFGVGSSHGNGYANRSDCRRARIDHRCGMGDRA